MIVHRGCGGLVTTGASETIRCLYCETVITDSVLEGTQLTISSAFISPKANPKFKEE
jgi:hypothetical protein